MFDYSVAPAGPHKIEKDDFSGAFRAVGSADSYIPPSRRAEKLKKSNYIVCGIVIDRVVADFDEIAHDIYEICSSKSVHPVILTDHRLPEWKRRGFDVEWHSAKLPSSDAYLNDLRSVWDMDVVTSIDTFVQAL